MTLLGRGDFQIFPGIFIRCSAFDTENTGQVAARVPDMDLGTTPAAWLRGLQFQGAGTWEMRAEPWRYDPSVQARWLASADSHWHSAEHVSVIF